MDKPCTKCGRSDVEFYYAMRRGAMQRHPWCKDCKREANKSNWARRNGDDGTPLSSQMKTARRERNRAYVAARKLNQPCADCQQLFPSYVMDYDHLDRASKIDRVANLVHRGVSLITLQDEIDKCELVCANCHRIRTHEGEHWMGTEGVEPTRS